MEETCEIDENIAVKGDLELNLNTLKMVPCPYVDIITEFADVEIFLISFDSLLLELCAHRYHNWILGGQTIVISEQLKHFLCALEELNAKFKIVVFSDLSVLFNKNGYLSKWSGDIEIFNSPLDKRWNVFLHQLTPSFILMSLENASPREIFGIEKLTIDEKDKKKKQIIYEDIDFASFFVSICLDFL
uniref:ATP-dependent RNA helicase DDX60 PIN-like domain-containing protein n=1 Tax=Meloidogyne javanica TaxID=6303 RepID=A0A915M0L1_MELJA